LILLVVADSRPAWKLIFPVENPCVGGSIPPQATIKVLTDIGNPAIQKIAGFFVWYSMRPACSRQYMGLSLSGVLGSGYSSCRSAKVNTAFKRHFEMKKKFPVHPANPERICWGCDMYCSVDSMACANERSPHPSELFGEDWLDWGNQHGAEPPLTRTPEPSA
jgi:hypothetical protein